jgi:DNA-binding CsgD family transcriptional regulator
VRLPENPSLVVSFLTLDADQSRSLPRYVERSLTAREYEVAGFAALGLRDGEIAERLLLSPHTVKEYLKSVYRKLNVRSRVELTRLLTESHPPTP